MNDNDYGDDDKNMELSHLKLRTKKCFYSMQYKFSF